MLSSLLLIAAIVWPPGAQIIERSPVPSPKGPRELVLWMANPTRHANETEYCGTAVHGDHWEGKSHLSLIDPAANRIINTVVLPPELLVPFQVHNTVWHVPNGPVGKPQILFLKDLTGEGNAAQFPIFTYLACGLANSGAAGYSAKRDRAILYHFVTHKEPYPWAMQIFSQKPVRPGHWDFVWTPAHGTIDYLHERVDFDPVRQLFVREAELVPQPHLPNFLPKGARLIEQQLIEWTDPLRLLALWMDKPRYSNVPTEYYGGSELLYGPSWHGPAHLSLIDPMTNRVINTLDLPKNIPIPAAGYYPGRKDRTPVLFLQDLTGEGIKAQFFSLEYLNSSTNTTRAYGYSPTKDRAVQYPILTGANQQWAIPDIFQQPQTRPGLWKFTHYGDHGDDSIYDEYVTFDHAGQLFRRRVKITKQPQTPKSAPPPPTRRK